MKKILAVLFSSLALLVAFFPVEPAKADSIYCFCSTDNQDIEVLKSTPDPECKQMSTDECNNYSKKMESAGQVGYTCLVNKTKTECTTKIDNWKKQKAKTIADLANSDAVDKKIAGSKSSQFLPACILEEKLNLNGDCGDVTIFVKLMLDIVNYLLSFVGGLALLFFIYGGFILIFSGGAPDKITQGKEIIMSALIGLVVAFCGYVLVSFLGDAIGISSVYKLK